MHFKRFFNIKDKNNNILIIFKNNKIIFEPNLKTFLLDENFLDINVKDHLYVGIANNGNDIFAVDISNYKNDINIGYKSLVEFDIRHLLTMLVMTLQALKRAKILLGLILKNLKLVVFQIPLFLPVK